MALFGEYQIQASFKSNLSASLELSTFNSKATFNTINKDITSDNTKVEGSGGDIEIDPYDLETYFAEDYNPDTRQTFTD